MRIRPGTKIDLYALQALLCEHGTSLQREGISLQEQLDSEFRNGFYCTVIESEDRKRILGFATYEVSRFGANNRGNSIFVSTLVVRREVRRQGLGSAILDHLIQDNAAARLSFNVQEDNLSGCNFLKEYGAIAAFTFQDRYVFDYPGCAPIDDLIEGCEYVVEWVHHMTDYRQDFIAPFAGLSLNKTYRRGRAKAVSKLFADFKITPSGVRTSVPVNCAAFTPVAY